VRVERRVPPPRRLRGRLAVAFVVSAGLASGLLALGSYLLVREARLRDSLERAERLTRLVLLHQARGLGPGVDLQQFVESYRRLEVPAVLFAGGERYASDPAVDPEIPRGLRRLVEGGDLAYQRIEVGGEPALVVGGRAPGSSAELYFVFPEGGIARDLRFLAAVLSVGWAAVTATVGAVGWAVAGRTLAPVGAASRAARKVAEGVLETRLPASSRDEFGDWAAAFNEMAEALEAKIRALQEAEARERRFTSDVAHELRTPLTALVAEASLLAEHLAAMPEPARRPAQLLVGDVARLRRLVEDLMEISRLDAGVERVERDVLELGELVAAVVRARGWGEAVTLSLEPVVLATDRRRVERIVANLVGNAVEHAGGATVRVGREGAEAVVEVVDRGPGIAPEHLPHVFERFYKADPSRAAGGTGLGLAIALEHARLLGGGIEVASEVGAGTRFTLRLPVAEPLRDGDTGVARALHDGRVDGRGGGRR
ncbi:MAG TPA: HAMP domain-containing sensor histidine kinase, partial [Actinomycetota bacterium]|nr:HAMP domain-containing sensor histidine kinase [Actinomycetota bacterium]